ncbi:MAG: hypothetical protein Q8O26_17860, partial [Phreatobacter sp.]|uniref:beta strand repeat-containing protein n=1 Tax=Phreatobacter sp. TaxID=1966341 RepID=UPI002754D0A5|nr:hypothetical protein [Phreatobacter sp.]
MPNVPVSWLQEFVVAPAGGSVSRPTMIQLSNGNMLVAWHSSNDTGPGAPAGRDIIGQVFDPLGNRVGTEFRVNQFSQLGNEQLVSLAALPDGGFTAVYESQASNGVRSIFLDQFNALGTVSNGSTVEIDFSTNAPNVSNPRMAVMNATTAMVVYERFESGINKVIGKIYNPTTGTYGPEIVVSDSAEGATGPEVAVLSSGKYAVVMRIGGSDPSIIYTIYDSAGAFLSAFVVPNTDANLINEIDPDITALDNGRFVISWTRQGSATDVGWQMFDESGAVSAPDYVGTGSFTNNNNESSVTALADGNFVVVYDDDQTSGLRVEHVSSQGVVLGVFMIAGPDPSQPTVVGLEDGRFAVVWLQNTSTVMMEILDTRNAVNTPVYAPEGWQVGTNGHDIIGQTSEIVHGWNGNDEITEANGSGNTSIFGDDGNDTIFVVTSIGSDYFNGGIGVDRIDWSAVNEIGATFDLQLGLAGDTGGNEEEMLGFENLTGTNNADTILGSVFENALDGGAGNDTIIGRDGSDLITGGAGNDAIDGGTGNDAAIWLASRSNYLVRSFVSAGTFYTQVSAVTGNDGVDLLVNVETLGFNSGGQAFGNAGIQQNLVANIDGSLYDDALFQNTATGQILYQNMNAGTGSGFNNVLGSLPAGWRLVGSDDFTGDGRADTLVQDTNTGSIYTVNIASGAPVWGVVNTGLTSAFQAIASGDVTRDGTADVLVRDTATGVNYIADMNAGGTFGGWVLGPNLGTGWRTVGLGDFNTDGASDVLVQNIADGTTYYRDMVNNQWGLVSGAVGSQWVAREAGDLNGDGYADVVFRNTATSDIWWVNMLGGTNAGWSVVANGLAGWDVRGSADVDNDGYRDVIVQNTANGTTYYADMNNGAFAGWGTVSGALGTQW